VIRIAGLYDRIWEWSNLRRAAHRAFRASRQGAEPREYFSNLDENLRSLQKALLAGDVKLCPYREFLIHDPKERLISAPAFADRVLHHAVMGVCEPLFDRWSIADSYACRRGRGRLAALERATDFSRRFPWFFRGDIRKYFPSIQHPLLKLMIRRKFKDQRLIALFEQLVDSFGFDEGKGLPIGSLCSQHLANLFLDPFDRWVKEVVRLPGYVRYMDDFVIFSDSQNWVVDCQRLVGEVLSSKLGLELKGDAHLNRSRHGFDFLGFRIFPGWRILNRRSRRRFRARFDELEQRHQRGSMGEMELQRRVGSLLAFAKEGCSWKFRSAVLSRASNA
jgi:RNA-directed DNA polymerase